jgi:hypothetical protein
MESIMMSDVRTLICATPTDKPLPEPRASEPVSTSTADEQAAAEIKAEQEARKRAKAAGRIAKLKAKKNGDTQKMPLEGKAALAAIAEAQAADKAKKKPTKPPTISPAPKAKLEAPTPPADAPVGATVPVMTTKQGEYPEMPAFLKRTVTPEAKAAADAVLDKAISERSTGRVLKNPPDVGKTKKQPSAASLKPVKPTKSGIARASKDRKSDGPSGVAAEALKLASRKLGATRNELIELTQWTGAPWKWLFWNSKKNGWCQRFGFSLTVISRKDGSTAYAVAKADKPKLTVQKD